MKDADVFKTCSHTLGVTSLLNLNSCQVSTTSSRDGVILAPTLWHYSFPEHSQTCSAHHPCLCHFPRSLKTFCQAWILRSCDGNLTFVLQCLCLKNEEYTRIRLSCCHCFPQWVNRGWLRWQGQNVWFTETFPWSVLLSANVIVNHGAGQYHGLPWL